MGKIYHFESAVVNSVVPSWVWTVEHIIVSVHP